MKAPAPVLLEVRPPRISLSAWLRHAYGFAWTGIALVGIGSGAVVGLLSVPVAKVSWYALAIGAFSLVGQQMVQRPLILRSRRLRVAVLTALAGTGGYLSMVGTLRLLGPLGIVLVALLAATSPILLSRCAFGLRRLTRLTATPGSSTAASTDDSGQGTSGGTAAAPSTEALTDAQLCRAWRMSYLALQRSQEIGTRAELVQRRQDYLDELERRNPSGFARWLYRGARPASDPSPYLLRPGHDDQEVLT